jgi:hypothetical protein
VKDEPMTREELYESFKPGYATLFPYFHQTVLSDGGDGEGLLFTRYVPKELIADAFEKYLIAQGTRPLRFIRDNHISLCCSEESWTFYDGEGENMTFPGWITVRIYT